MKADFTEQAKVEDTYVLEHITTMTSDINSLKERIGSLRRLLDEGTCKIDALLNIVNNIKSTEQNIAVTGEDKVVLQQMSEEQINSFLEMLKSPAFQSLARQLMNKWVNSSYSNKTP